MMLEIRGSEGLKVRIKGIRLGLLASLVCKVIYNILERLKDA